MKRSDKYKMLIELKQSNSLMQLFNHYSDIKPYRVMWHKDNDKHAKAAIVFIPDIAPPVTPEIDSVIPLDVRYALQEQYGDQIKQDLQNTLDMIDNKKQLEKAFKK